MATSCGLLELHVAAESNFIHILENMPATITNFELGGSVVTSLGSKLPSVHGFIGRGDQNDQNMSCYMVTIPTEKWWWWPLFLFCIDITVNIARQLYCIQPVQPRQKAIDLLVLKKEAVNVYYARNRCLRETVEILPSPRKLEKVNKSIRYHQTNYW